ncbi:MAG: hypothetical protein ACTS80_01670 [Candidatus Hodgkinia cicadicola]
MRSILVKVNRNVPSNRQTRTFAGLLLIDALSPLHSSNQRWHRSSISNLCGRPTNNAQLRRPQQLNQCAVRPAQSTLRKQQFRVSRRTSASEATLTNYSVSAAEGTKAAPFNFAQSSNSIILLTFK